MTTTLRRRKLRIAERLQEKYTTAAPPKPGRPPMAFYYVRYSDPHKQGKGHTVESQVAECDAVFERDYAGEFAKAPMPYIDAGVSAKKNSFDQRPNGQRLLADVQKGDIIIAYKGDRMFRSLEHTLATMNFLHRMGVRLRLCDDRMQVDWGTAVGKMLFSILSAVSEYDSELKGERVRDTLRIAKQNGAMFGPKPTFVEHVRHNGRKRWVIKAQYVDALDWMAEQIRAKSMGPDKLLRETRKRMAAGDGMEFDNNVFYSLGRSQFYESVRPRFKNWSKATGKTLEQTVNGETRTRWLYPSLPENDKTQEG